MKKYRDDIIAIAFIMIVLVVRFYPFIFFGTSILSDSWKSYYPWRMQYDASEIKTINYDSTLEYASWFPMVKDELKNGRFPHWNDKSYSGNPWYANHLIPVFHIPFAISLLFSGELIFTAYSFLMALIGSLFFYWYLRNWNLTPLVSFYGATVILLAGWQMYLYPPEVASLIWIPAVLLFYDRFIARGFLLDASLGALCFGQLLIGGYPVYVAHFFYIFVLYFIWRRFHKSFAQSVDLKRWITGVSLIFIGGALISLVQNYPTWEYSKLTWRGLSSEASMIGFASSETQQRAFKHIKTDEKKISFKTIIADQIRKRARVIVPEFLKDFNESRNFTGPTVILLALIGLFGANRKFKLIKILLLIFTAFFIIPPLFIPFAKIIPGWSISALLPREVFFFLLFFMSALGLDSLLKSENRNSLFGWLSIVMLFIYPILRWFLRYNPNMDNVEPIRWSEVNDAAVVMIYSLLSLWIMYFIYLRSTGRLLKWFPKTFPVLFVVSALLSHFYIFSYFDTKNPLPLTGDIQKIQEICGKERIVRFDPTRPSISFKERLDYVLPPNLPAKFGLYDSLGYDNMLLANLLEYFQAIETTAVIRQRAIPHLQNIDSFTKQWLLASGAGPRYIMTRGDLDPMFTNLIPAVKVHDGDIDLYDFMNHSCPPIRFVNAYMVDKNKNDSHELKPSVVRLKKDLATHLKIYPGDLKTSRDYAEYPAWNFTPIEISDVTRTPTYVEIKFNAPSNGLLYIGDTYHPRWRAKLDGEEVEIYEANIAFRAIPVPRGEHVVTMWYDGVELYKSGIISVFALLLVFLVGFIDSQLWRKKESVN